MKISMKLGLALIAVAALALSLLPISNVSAGWPPECPPNECPEVLDGYTYVSTCASDTPGSVCLGWIYEKRGELCHVAALGG